MKKLIKKIRGFILRKIGVKQLIQQNQQIIETLKFISNDNKEIIKAITFNNTIIDSEWFRQKSVSPGGWAVDYSLLYTLYRVLNDMRPKSIIEFGLGQSSKLIHQYTQYFEDVNAITFEHDPEWIKYFQASTNGSYKTNVKLIEIEDVNYKGFTTLSIKDIDKQIENNKFDFILVDAPFGSEHYSRSQILQLAQNNLCDEFCIIIDDYNRVGEKETVDDLIALFNSRGIEYHSNVYVGSKNHFLVCSFKYQFLSSL